MGIISQPGYVIHNLGKLDSLVKKGYIVDEFGNNVEASNRSNSQTRHLILSSDYRFDFEDDSSLNTSLTFDTQEYIRYRYLNTEYEEDSIKDYAFSQDRLKASALYDFSIGDKLNVIAGVEFSTIDVGAPWGKNQDHLWIREGSHIVSDFEDSVYTRDLTLPGRPKESDYVEVGSGMRFDTYTHLL